MNTTEQDSERDSVLFEMHKVLPNPTAEQIIEWVKRYPQLVLTPNYLRNCNDK